MRLQTIGWTCVVAVGLTGCKHATSTTPGSPMPSIPHPPAQTATASPPKQADPTGSAAPAAPSVQPIATSGAEAADPERVITDIKGWDHRVKSVFGRLILGELYKVVLTQHGTYPTFYLESALPVEQYDRFLYEVGQANGYWDYQLIRSDDRTGGGSVQVGFDRSDKHLVKIARAGDVTTFAVRPEGSVEKRVTEHDFQMKVNGQFTIWKDRNLQHMFQTLGYGSASENNNYGYISDTLYGASYRGVRYDGLHVNAVAEVISDIEVEESVRGLHIGDPEASVVAAYGDPDVVKTNQARRTYIYRLADKQLHLTASAGAVERISFVFENSEAYYQ